MNNISRFFEEIKEKSRTADIISGQQIIDNKPKLLMRTERVLSNTKVIIVLLIIEDLFFFFIVNYLTNVLFNLPRLFTHEISEENAIGFVNILPRPMNFMQNVRFYVGVYSILLIFCVVIDIVTAYKMKTSFAENYINIGQKGDERFSTNEEIKQQYKEITDRNKSFSGYGGTIISRIGNKLYIDQTPTNNLILGSTRSGKGEMFVISSIDVYSRAEKKSSLVVCDPKMELYKSSKRTLEERGYDVYLLNLDDPLHSMGFNPLEQIALAYVEKDYANAELLAQAFSYSIFNPDSPTNTDAFWQDTASSLLSALILAHIEDCVKADEETNITRYKEWKRKRDAFDRLPTGEAKIQAKNHFYEIKNKLKQNSESRHKEADILRSAKIQFIPEDILFEEKHDNLKKINMYSIINTFTELVRIPSEADEAKTRLDDYFNKRPTLNRAKLKYSGIEVAGDKTKGSIYASMLAKLTIFTNENIAKMTAESSFKLEDIGFGDRPIAIFMGIPDYDKSTHFMATIFIRQMYFVLAKKATRFRSGKCTRNVKVIADEFGNMPAIENMEGIITVCLGRNISFDLYVQAYSQLNKLYGDDADTIKDNCGNEIYIMTNNTATAKEFSEKLGNKTIIDVQRSGERMNMHKHFMEQPTEKPLLSENELMRLMEGECVVRRSMKRKDNEGNRIVPRPIFNSEESGKRLIYRYEYLTDTFPNPGEIDLYEINTEDRSFVNLKERVWDFNLTFMWFAYNSYEKEEKTNKELGKLDNYKQVAEASKKLLGYIPAKEIKLFKFLDEISNAKIKDDDKKILQSLVTLGE